MQKNKPIIKSIEWGKITVIQNKNTYIFKDVILEPTTCYEWNFKSGFDKYIDKNQTSHQFQKDKSKGIQPYLVRNLLHKASIFILTTGFHNDLGVNEDTINFLKDNNKHIIIVNTSDVMDIYNNLIKKRKRVIALIHSTC